MKDFEIHSNPALVLARGEAGVMKVLLDMMKDTRVHPTNAVCVLMAALAKELGRQARQMGRTAEAEDLIMALRGMVREVVPVGASADALAREVNACMLRLMGVTPQ